MASAAGSQIGHGGEKGLDWALLRSFVAVMRTGSLSGAADAIGQTQPTIGRQIKALEERLGEQLFIRRANSISPTPRALSLFERAILMEEAAIAVERLVAGGQEDVSGTVRVSVPEMFGLFLIPGMIAEFHAEFPNVAVELVATNDTNDLVRREADIAVRFFRPTQLDLVMTRVGVVHIGAFAAHDYIERFGAPQTLQDFGNHRMVGEDTENRILSGMKRFGLSVNRKDFCFRSDSIAAQVAAIEAGIGIGASMSFVFDRNKVQRILTRELNIPFEVHVVAHTDLHRSRRIRALYDHLVDGLRYALSRLPAEKQVE